MTIHRRRSRMRQFELEFLDDPSAWDNKVIKEEPYVRILGKVGWDHRYQSYTAVAQVDTMICIVALKLKGVACKSLP